MQSSAFCGNNTDISTNQTRLGRKVVRPAYYREIAALIIGLLSCQLTKKSSSTANELGHLFLFQTAMRHLEQVNLNIGNFSTNLVYPIIFSAA